jgi:hypothetical protein
MKLAMAIGDKRHYLVITADMKPMPLGLNQT